MSEDKKELLNAIVAEMVESVASTAQEEGLPPTTAKMAAILELVKKGAEVYGVRTPEMDKLVGELEQVVLGQHLREPLRQKREEEGKKHGDIQRKDGSAVSRKKGKNR